MSRLPAGRSMIASAVLASMMAALTIFSLTGPARAAEPGYSAARLYNEANAYARAGKPGMAVLHYERAALLAPGDADIDANLGLVLRSQHLAVAPRSTVARMLSWPSPSTAALGGELGLLLLGGALLAAKRRMSNRTVRWVAGALGVLLLSLPVCQGMLLWPRLKDAVVIAHEAQVLESPVPMAAPLFTLPEAQTVSVLAGHDEFLLIRSPDDRSGWVSAASVARVVSRR